jgi:phosphatidylglycerophosphatase A
VAPGTFGTLVAIPLAIALRDRFDDLGYALAVGALFVVGIGVSQITARDLGVADHGSIVWDEVVAFLAVLFFVGDDWRWVAVAFLLFRFFDIVKPPPIRAVDARLKNGFGVMADDLLAAGYTLLALAVLRRLLG